MRTEAIAVLTARVNIDVLPHVVGNKLKGVGIRIRPYGKQAVRDVMILGYGATFEDALMEVYQHAYDKRWESLSWAARPWATDEDEAGGSPFAGPTAAF